jgi:hypothetical protein
LTAFFTAAYNCCPHFASLTRLNINGVGTRKGFSMAYVLYQDHTIISTAVYDVVTGNWRLTACISWQASGDHIYFLKDCPERFSRVEEAEMAGLEHSKRWVDRKLSSSVLT